MHGWRAHNGPCFHQKSKHKHNSACILILSLLQPTLDAHVPVWVAVPRSKKNCWSESCSNPQSNQRTVFLVCSNPLGAASGSVSDQSAGLFCGFSWGIYLCFQYLICLKLEEGLFSDVGPLSPGRAMPEFEFMALHVLWWQTCRIVAKVGRSLRMIGSNTYLSLAAKPSWSQCWNKEQLAGLWTLRHRTSQQRNHSTKVMPFKPKLRCYGLTTAIYRGYLSSTKSLGYLSSISSKVPQIQRHWNHSSYLIRCAQVLAQK